MVGWLVGWLVGFLILFFPPIACTFSDNMLLPV